MTTPADSAQLLSAAQQGDTRALQHLLELHAPTVSRFAARLCDNPVDAEDVAQETLLAAVKALPQFRGDSSLTTWLYAVTRSLCARQRRRGRSVRRADVSLDAPEGQGVADAYVAEHEREGMDSQLAEAVDAAIAGLELPYREVLHLRDVEGLTAPEVSEGLGLQVATVKTRLHRARAQVRAKLEPILADAVVEPSAAGPGCPDILRLFSRHLEGEISADTCARMENHVSQCPNCTRQCDALRRTVALCRIAPGPHVPVGTQAMVRFALRRAAA